MPTTLVEAARQATASFPDPASAEAAGYVHMQGCVSGPQEGAMGMHYVNVDLIDDELDAAQPEILIYAPQDGAMKFVGVEYYVIAEDWAATHEGSPELMGQLLHYAGAFGPWVAAIVMVKARGGSVLLWHRGLCKWKLHPGWYEEAEGDS